MLVILFALWANEPAPTEIAYVASRGACDLIAKVMNADPDKPREVRFGCYERRPAVEG